MERVVRPAKEEVMDNVDPEANASGWVKCDADCPAQALEVFIKGMLTLSLCGHHSNSKRATLIGQGFESIEIASVEQTSP